jgi:hypothetical protein
MGHEQSPAAESNQEIESSECDRGPVGQRMSHSFSRCFTPQGRKRSAYPSCVEVPLPSSSRMTNELAVECCAKRSRNGRVTRIKRGTYLENERGLLQLHEESAPAFKNIVGRSHSAELMR